MSQSVQILVDSQGKPAYAVLPYQHYLTLIQDEMKNETQPTNSLLSHDGRYITLPNGGPGARIDVLRLADLVQRRGLFRIAINQRAQALDKFPKDQRATLDPLIRRVFLAEDSAYKNTMQASQEVVDALVETGIFKRVQADFDCFYRAVKALEVDNDGLAAYLEKHGSTDSPIDVGELA